MYNASNTKEQIKVFTKLLFPVLIYQLISYSSGMIGAFMAGHYSTKDLAGLSMGINIWHPVISIISTFVLAIIPIVSNLLGSGEENKIETKVRQFIYIGFIIALIISIFLYYFSSIFISNFNINEEISSITKNFLKYQSFGVIPIVLYSLLRSFIDSLGLTKISMNIMLIYVPINILLSYIFIFGKFGFPELGGVGVAVATNITYIISLVLVYIVIKFNPKINKYDIFGFEFINFKIWIEIFKLATPMALAVALETFMFSILSLLLSNFDTATIAAHQSSLNFAGFLYGLPMSISSALTIIVSYYLGSKDYKMANKYIRIATGVSFLFSFVIVMIIMLFNNKIPYLYGTDPNFVRIAEKLLYFVIGFTIFDSFSAFLVGVLRAYKKVVATCICLFIGFYMVGVPLAFYLIYVYKIGVYGLWIAWLSGIGVYSILMVIYYLKYVKIS